MKLSFPSPEFDDAVAAVCHGLAGEDVMRALNELLRSNAGARDEYLLRVALHARLASDSNLFVKVANAGAAGCSRVINLDDWRGAITSSQVVRTSRRKLAQVFALAACLVLMAAGIWSLWLRPHVIGDGATSTAVAMLTRAVDAHWGQNPSQLRVGCALEPGRLRLESGLAQVVFYSGARVVIEGPAELQLLSPNEVACTSGRILAEVPQPARGFRLKTDELDVVDLGTAFGVEVTRGRTEVHVFKGTVEVQSGTAVKQILDEGQAAVTQEKGPLRIMAANTAAFSELFEIQDRSLASEAYRYEQWQEANTRLNQDPSLLVHLEFQNLNTSDWTLRNTAERNRSVQEATIVGCRRAEGRWREKQALEFQSVNDRVRLDVPGAFDAVTLSAWVCVKGLDREFNSLFMCDGFEAGTLHWLIRDDGVLGLTVFGPHVGNLDIVASPPVLTLDKLGMWLHLAVVVDGKARQVIHYVNGDPVSRHRLKLGPPFRIGPAELGNWHVKSGPNPAPALIRNLSGALDEFELFNRALNDNEVRDLYAKGKTDL